MVHLALTEKEVIDEIDEKVRFKCEIVIDTTVTMYQCGYYSRATTNNTFTVCINFQFLAITVRTTRRYGYDEEVIHSIIKTRFAKGMLKNWIFATVTKR